MWILLLMILIMPFEENPYLYLGDSFLGIFPKFTVIKLLGLIGLAWSGVQFLGGQAPLGLLTSSQTRAFLAFLCAIAAGGLASGAGVYPVTRLIAIVGLLPLLTAAVRSERDLKRIVVACAAIMAAVFPYALRQMYRFGGRLGVGLHESNYFALVLVLVLPLSFVLAREARGYRRLLWLVATGVICLELMLTGSRGGFLGFVLALTLVALRLLKSSVPALAGGAVAALLLLFIVPNPMTRRLTASGLSDDARDSGIEASNRQRLAELKGGLRMVAENPLTGVGLGNFKAELPKYVQVEQSNIAHNTYLELAAELGLPALVAFCFVAVSALRSLERSAILARQAGDRWLRELALGLQAGLAGYLLGALFLSAQYEKFFWLVMFLSICLERVTRRKARVVRHQAAVAAA